MIENLGMGIEMGEAILLINSRTHTNNYITDLKLVFKT